MNVGRSARGALALLILTALLLHPHPSKSGSERFAVADNIAALADDHRTVVWSANLRQNPDNTVRLLVPDKCEREGEEELRRMALDGDIEEAYVFLPSRCLWIELGYDETATTVRPDAGFALSLISSKEPVVFYHTHVGAQTVETVAPGGFPAYRDLIGSILIGGDVPLTDRRPIVHRAVTAAGVFEYSLALSPEVVQLIATLRDTGLTGYIAQNLAYLFAGPVYEKAYYDAVASCIGHGEQTGDMRPECFPMLSHPFVLNYSASGGSLQRANHF